MIRAKPDRRMVNFLFNPLGGNGKSLTADYIELNPDFNALLVPQLASPERWVSAFIDQMEKYKLLNGYFPTTILVDMTRNEDNSNVESFYSTLENIKNGRVDSTFYGRFKRLRFKPPHVIVFTNNVPNLSALSSDRFRLFALANEDHNFTMMKCNVKLEITTVSRSFVTWYYKATVCSEAVQRKFYKKILNADMTKMMMSALINADGSITEKEFLAEKQKLMR